MTQKELIQLLRGEEAFFSSLADLKEAVLYGSALQEDELSHDVDLLLVPARELAPGETTELRQAVWERLKDRLPVPLEVNAASGDMTPGALASRGIPALAVFER